MSGIEEMEQKIMEAWKKLAKDKYGIDYEISFDSVQKEMIAEAQGDALLRQFGSGTNNVKAEFWFEKLKSEFEQMLSNGKIKL